MAVDVTLTTYDYTDSSLNDSLTLKNVKYDLAFDRGVKIYRMKIVRVLQEMLKLSLGEYKVPPVIALDTGSTIYTYHLECILKGNPNATYGPVDDVERQMIEIQDFIDTKAYIADMCFLKIGRRIASRGVKLTYRYGRGVEGKIMKGKFTWVSKEHAIIKFSFDFVDCVDLDLY